MSEVVESTTAHSSPSHECSREIDGKGVILSSE
jgi:hypothetical protein